jgi:hypothetical protein
MNLTAARMKIKFLDEPDHHGAAVPVHGLLLDRGHSQMKSWIPSATDHTEIARPVNGIRILDLAHISEIWARSRILALAHFP